MPVDPAELIVPEGHGLADPAFLAVAVPAVAASVWAAGIVAGRLRRGEAVVAWRPHGPVPWSGGEVLLILCLFVLCSGAADAAVRGSDSIVGGLAAQVVALVATTVAGAALLRLRGASWADLGWRPGPWRKDLWLALVTVALVVAPLLGLAALLDRLQPYQHPLIDLLAERRDPRAIAAVLLSALVVAPIAEEFFFRRVLQGWLERVAPDRAGLTAIVVSAAAFALAHWGQGLAYVPLFPFALALGGIVRQTGSLVPCVLVHALFNAVSVGLLLAGVADAG